MQVVIVPWVGAMHHLGPNLDARGCKVVVAAKCGLHYFIKTPMAPLQIWEYGYTAGCKEVVYSNPARLTPLVEV